MAARLSALRTGSALLIRTIIFLLLVLISVRGWVNPIQILTIVCIPSLISAAERLLACQWLCYSIFCTPLLYYPATDEQFRTEQPDFKTAEPHQRHFKHRKLTEGKITQATTYVKVAVYTIKQRIIYATSLNSLDFKTLGQYSTFLHFIVQ
jgi:hypothetical protein